MSSLADPAVCDRLATALPAVLDARAVPPARLAEHVERCLSCQAELARYRRLLRRLSQLAGDRVDLPPGALGELVGVLGSVARRSAIRSALAGRRMACGAGLAVGCLAVTGALVLGRLRTLQRPAAL